MPAGSPISLITTCTPSWQGAKTLYPITQCDAVHAGPVKAIGILLIGPILNAMGKLLLLVAQTSG